jgi:hypothetical protein
MHAGRGLLLDKSGGVGDKCHIWTSFGCESSSVDLYSGLVVDFELLVYKGLHRGLLVTCHTANTDGGYGVKALYRVRLIKKTQSSPKKY